jgi:hypothetical protein
MSVTLAACSGGSSPPSASSNAGTPDPNAVLRFGVDLNNGFSKDFDPGSNECSFQELSRIYSSITYEPPGTQGNRKSSLASPRPRGPHCLRPRDRGVQQGPRWRHRRALSDTGSPIWRASTSRGSQARCSPGRPHALLLFFERDGEVGLDDGCDVPGPDHGSVATEVDDLPIGPSKARLSLEYRPAWILRV